MGVREGGGGKGREGGGGKGREGGRRGERGGRGRGEGEGERGGGGRRGEGGGERGGGKRRFHLFFPLLSVDYATRGTTADNSPSTYGLWHVEAYLSWLDFYEQAVGGATPPLSEALCVAVRELLLTASLLPKLAKL